MSLTPIMILIECGEYKHALTGVKMWVAIIAYLQTTPDLLEDQLTKMMLLSASTLRRPTEKTTFLKMRYV